MMRERLSWRMHWRLIVVAAVLTVVCWGGVLAWNQAHPIIQTGVVIYPATNVASPSPQIVVTPSL